MPAVGLRLPADLVHHLLQAGGGGVCLVVGAGTSMEAPTSLKSAADYAKKAYLELIEEGVLVAGACARPEDLSLVADAVFAATSSQVDLVQRLPHNEFKAARPNRGHLVAVACLLERATSAVITLNYDTSLIAAISELGAADRIGIIEGPEDRGLLKLTNVFFLHRSAHKPAEDWIIRSVDLMESWKNGWESLVAAQMAGSPSVLFAGLGTPVPVLIATVQRLRDAFRGDRDRVFLAGPGAAADNDFAVALQLDAANYVPLKWNSLMNELARRLVRSMADALAEAAKVIEAQRSYTPSSVADACSALQVLDLIDLGKLRAAWLLTGHPYQVEIAEQRPLLADVLLGIAQIEGRTHLHAQFAPSGLVTFAGSQRQSLAVAFASGSGHLNWLTLDAEIRNRLGQLGAGVARPRYAVVSAVHGRPGDAAAPEDIVRGVEQDSIIYDQPLSLLDLEEIRANPELAERLVA